MTGQRLLLALAWVAFPTSILVRDDATGLIASWAQPIVWTGSAALAALVLAAGLAARRTASAEDDDLPLWAWIGRCGIHLLPLYLISMVGIDSLGSSGITGFRPPATAPQEDRPPYMDPPTGVMSVSGGPPPERTRTAPRDRGLTLLDLYYPIDHPGVETVEVTGRWLALADAPKGGAGLPPDLDGLAYQHLVVCCAADAQPVPVGLRDLRPEPRTPLAFAKDAWIRIRGRWIHPVGENGLAIIEVERVSTTDAPDNPYLSPRWR
ncbi:MAG: hypothetical protein RLZZ127_2544 [Planctomycetota bacterium]|jgi:hypothetical protein